MRKIEAIVRSGRLDGLRKAFLEAGINKMTVTEVREYGNAHPHREIYRSEVFSVDSHAKVKVETIVPWNMVPIVIALLKTKGQTGNSEEEKILISSVNDVGRASR